MTTIHDEFLELAAAAIDFELTEAERAALAGHLAGCIPCRRRVTGFEADQRAVEQLPSFVLAPAAVDQVRGRIQRTTRPVRPTLRLLAIAAVLALLAVAAFTVGAEMLRRQADRDLTVVPPTIGPVVPPSSSPGPNASPRPGILAAGSVADVVVTGLRVRTAPTVDNTKSAKLEPLLGIGTQLQIIEGPVTADDYDWYLVQAIGLPHRGWVAAADHDGSPWVQDRTAAATAVPTLGSDEAALKAGLRPDASVACAPKRTGLPERATAGIECDINAGVVARVGAYRFADARDAAMTYLERMASKSVAPASGDCPGGTSGDAPWMAGDRTSGPDSDRVNLGATGPWVVGRSGCFLDVNENANVRVTCGATYIGIVGRNGDVAALHRWAMRAPDGTTEPGARPGICLAGA
jgi:hypothetical protein